MKITHSLGSLVVAVFAFAGCSHGLAQRDRRPDLARADGYFVSGDEATERGGVAGYVPRFCSKAGWGAPGPCSAPTPVPVAAVEEPVIQTQAAVEKPNELDITFYTGSAKLTNDEKGELDRLADTLSANPDTHLTIIGYTDSVGDEASNLVLSRRRARAVKDYLVSCGVEKSRLTTKAYGEAHPVADNDTVSGRAKNRRVTAIPIAH